MNKINIEFLKNGIAQKDGVNYLNIDLLSTKESDKEDNKKNNLFMFLLDNSGSMNIRDDYELSRLDFAKKAINNFIDNLENEDKIGLITFNTVVDTIIPVIKTNNKGNLKDKVNRIRTSGCTDMGIGLDLARELISSSDLENYNCKIILLSDGDINRGKGLKELVALSENFLENGITISSLGIGNDYNSKLMNDICTSLFYHIKNLSVLDDILNKELSLNNRVVYNNVKVSIKSNSLVEIKNNLNDYTEKEKEDSKVIYVGNLISNINKNILLEIGNDFEKEDIDFEIVIEFSKEEKSVIKKILKVVSKEELEKIKENEEILKLVTEYLKRNTIQQSTLSYMENRDISKVNTFNEGLKNKFGSLYGSMGLSISNNSLIEQTLNEVNTVATSYSSNSVSDLKESYAKYSNKRL